MVRTRKQTLVLGAALMAIGGGTGAALASEVAAPDLSTPSAAGIAASAPSGLAGAFAILGQTRAPIDTLPASGASTFTTSGSFGAHYGVNVALSRLAGVAGGTSVWLAPGSTGSCIWLSSGGGACGSNESIAQRGISVALVPTAGGEATVIGVVPDGATVSLKSTAGAVHAVAISGDAFTLSGRGPTTNFIVHEPSGTAATIELPAGTPPPAPPAG